MTTTYSVRIDGLVFSMSTRARARKACAENATGGEVLGSDGTVEQVAAKAATRKVYQGDNFSGPT